MTNDRLHICSNCGISHLDTEDCPLCGWPMVSPELLEILEEDSE